MASCRASPSSVSPLGDRYALIAEVGAERDLWVFSADNRFLFRQPVGVAKVRGVRWGGEDHVLVAISKTYNLGADYGFKYEISQVFVADVRTKKGFWALGRNGSSSGVWGRFDCAEEKGVWYGYFPSLTTEHGFSVEGVTKSYPDLYRVNLDTGASAQIANGPGEGLIRQWLVSANGEMLGHSDYLEREGRFRLYRGGDNARIADLKDPYGDDDFIGEGRTPGSLLYRRTDADGQSHLIESPPGGGAERALFEDRAVEETIENATTGLWEGVTFGDGEHETRFFSPGLEAKMRGARKAFPGSRVEFISASDTLDRMVVYTDGDADSGTYWLVDIKGGAAVPIGYPYPQVTEKEIGPSRMVDYKAADGLALQGVLTLPPAREAKALPVVVFPHGGPQAHDQLGFDWWAQAFASRGYAVFQPNFRGSDGYGAALVAAGKGEWGRKMQTDISDGLAYLAAEGIVDPRRACIMGASYGGYAALAGVTLQHGLYRCAVSVAGVADLGAMLSYERERHGAQSETVRYWRDFMGRGGAVPPAGLSPAKMAANADAPVLLIHGKDDTVVQIEQSYEMQRALRGAGKTVELVVQPDEDHFLSREGARVAMLKAADAFIERYNPPH